MRINTKPIAETNNFIVLDHYDTIDQTGATYQTEADLENELIKDLSSQGYEYLPSLISHEALLLNLREQLEKLNSVKFSDSEWQRFLTEYLDRPSDTIIDKTRKIQNNHIYDFIFDSGEIKNIYLIDKKNIFRNQLQVINQFEQEGTFANRYDVTILVNGLPLVQVELKKRGVAIREAFNQIHRYTKESFNKDNSLFKFLQIFVISNGTDTRYFANTTKRDKNSFDFTMNWARSDNTIISDLKDFTATFLSKNTLLNILINYSIFDVENTLLIMRPYQIAATERILWKLKSAHNAKKWHSTAGGGFIWHTTGSGKTLTSFKTALMATELDFIDKVLFVVDRKDLDYQTMKEYRRFSPDSVIGSNNTAGLKRNVENNDNKIIVTTIQKLNNLIKSEDDWSIYNKQVVFIFDEAHRSQFGEAQKNINKKFKQFYQFGFTGTPIFKENALGAQTTESVFGKLLHSYVITDAIRDEKVLKFKVDYNNVRPLFNKVESEQDIEKLSAAETSDALLHPNRIKEISRYILDNFSIKTHRNVPNGKGFNAMFAVSSVEAAKAYYNCLKALQKDRDHRLKIATIFSFAANGEQDALCEKLPDAKGDIADESFDPSQLQQSDKEFLTAAINDYNEEFKCKFSVDSEGFQNYYRDLSLRVKKQEVDLLIVVGMFLTGFDAPQLNTLFVDKNLRYHALIQAYSRTNRIYNATKTFGNIITFRDLEQPTIDALKLFGQKNHDDIEDIALERSFEDYIRGYTDELTGERHRGYIEIVNELESRFSDPTAIHTEKDKKDFVKLFGEYLRIENILRNYDEFTCLNELQKIDIENPEEVAALQTKYQIDDKKLKELQEIDVPDIRLLQDYRSTYNDIRDWLRREREGKKPDNIPDIWEDVVFEVDLLKSQEINLDYILELIFEETRKNKDKATIIEEGRRLIRSSVGSRAKESLIVDFINHVDFDKIPDKSSIIDEFYQFAQKEQAREAEELIASEKLREDAAKRYLATSLKHEFANENGTDLSEALPRMSPLNPQYASKKKTVFDKISAFVEKFKGIGGKI